MMLLIKWFRTAYALLICTILLFSCQSGDQKRANEVNFTENVKYRGIVVYPSDIISVGVKNWVEMADKSGLNVIGIHADTRLETLPKLRTFLENEKGKLFLSECKKRNILVEYELHILRELLPRELHNQHPEFFRMDEDGKRQQEYNMCFTSEPALDIVANNAVEMAKWLKPTSHRYFFWTDDVQYYCHCDKCRVYTPSEQTLLYENAMYKALKEFDPGASVAHLAYVKTLGAPEKIKPETGVFLEYAPIRRDYNQPLMEDHLKQLEDNLKVFPPETAHVLEYWLDISMFSDWKKDDLKEAPWKKAQCERDFILYTGLGMRSITTFGAWINADYIQKFGQKNTETLLAEYGEVINSEVSKKE